MIAVLAIDDNDMALDVAFRLFSCVFRLAFRAFCIAFGSLNLAFDALKLMFVEAIANTQHHPPLGVRAVAAMAYHSDPALNPLARARRFSVGWLHCLRAILVIEIRGFEALDIDVETRRAIVAGETAVAVGIHFAEDAVKGSGGFCTRDPTIIVGVNVRHCAAVADENAGCRRCVGGYG
jgi:hypothetical protein